MESSTLYSLRKTSKVLCKTPLNDNLGETDIEDLLDAASWAPFHYAASAEHRSQLCDDAPEPWRIHVLTHEACLQLRSWLIDSGDMSKIPDMLAGASLLLQVTWCPNPPPADVELPKETRFYPSDINLEHIAATAAAIQNMLLCATEKRIPTYWSSGGPLRKPDVFKLLEIPDSQILLGSVFLFPENIDKLSDDGDIQIIPGKMRDKRSTSKSWSRTIPHILSKQT